MPSVKDLATSELNEFKDECQDVGTLGSECALAETQQLASFIGGTGEIA